MSWSDRPTDERLKRTAYVVEATDYESLALWRENHIGAFGKMTVTWEQDNPGFGPTIGNVEQQQLLPGNHVAGPVETMPIALSVFWNTLNGHSVAFYEPTSQVVDHRMVEKWLRKNIPAYAKGNHCNAMNFAHCLGWIAEQKR